MYLRFIFGFISLFILFTACEKTQDPVIEKPVDTELPTLTFTGISNNDTLRNTITAEIKGEDNTGIKSIEVFANNVLIASASKSPVNLSWNTLTVKDGSYTIKVVAKDSTGNKKEIQTAVLIKNVLFSIDYVNDPFSENIAYIIIDEDGKILNSFKFTSSTAPAEGEIIDIYPKTSFTGARVNVMRVKKGPTYRADYFLNIKRGHYAKKWKRFEFNYSSPEIGQRTIALKNIPSGFGQSICSSIGGSANTFDFQPSPNFIRYTNTSKILVMYEKNNDFLYNLFDVTKPSNGLQELDVALCTFKALSKTISFPAGAKNGSLQPWGGPNKDFDEIYHLGSKAIEGSPVKVFYPAELSNLSGDTYFTYQGDYHYRTYYSNLPANIELVNFNVSPLKRSLTDFSATFSGDFQFYIASFLYINQTNPVTVSVIGFKDQLNFKFPDISAEVSIPNFNPAQLPLCTFQMTKYDLPVDINMLFDWTLGPQRQGSRSNYASKTQFF